MLNVNGAAVVSLPKGGIAPSYLWRSARTASLRRRPVSYEHKNKKRATDRASVQRRAAPQTNKIYFTQASFSGSVLLKNLENANESVMCSLIVQNHALLHLLFFFKHLSKAATSIPTVTYVAPKRQIATSPKLALAIIIKNTQIHFQT